MISKFNNEHYQELARVLASIIYDLDFDGRADYNLIETKFIRMLKEDYRFFDDTKFRELVRTLSV
jgi:hypothetical protein